jgi:hypothetical protein
MKAGNRTQFRAARPWLFAMRDAFPTSTPPNFTGIKRNASFRKVTASFLLPRSSCSSVAAAGLLCSSLPSLSSALLALRPPPSSSPPYPHPQRFPIPALTSSSPPTLTLERTLAGPKGAQAAGGVEVAEEGADGERCPLIGRPPTQAHLLPSFPIRSWRLPALLGIEQMNDQHIDYS